METIIKDPADLSIHPLAKLLPEWDRDDERFKALARDIVENGIRQTLLISRNDLVIDGRKRWRAAKQQQVSAVECRVVPDEEIAGAILGGLIHRSHLTVGALAYVAYPLLQPAHEEAQRRKLAKLRKGQQMSVVRSADDGKTVEEFARAYGFGRTVFYQAREIHAAFAKTPTLKAEFESKIVEGEIGLGACLAGIAGKYATDGKARRLGEQLELFRDAFGTLKTRFAYWLKFDNKLKEQARPEIRSAVEAMPPDLRDEIKAAIRAVERHQT